jgi:hypothetical protein
LSGRLEVHLLKAEDLLLSDAYGNTIVSAAINKSLFGCIPHEFLTYEVLAQRTRAGTPLYRLVKRHGCYKFIPEHLRGLFEEPREVRMQIDLQSLFGEHPPSASG